MNPAPSDEVETSLLTLLYEHRLELALAIVVSHLMGWTSFAIDTAAGVC